MGTAGGTDSDNHVTNDTSQSGTGNVRISLIGMDKPFFTALAVALSIFSTIYAFEAGRETAQAVYWLQRNEAFLEQLSAQGVKVPQDLLRHQEK